MTTLDWMPSWLRDLWHVPAVTDVLVNGPGDVWLDRGIGLERAQEVVPGAVLPMHAADVRALAVRLASLGGRRLDDASPTVDARLPDGTRLHAVLPPVADGCAVVSLRRVRGVAFEWRDLVRGGVVPAELVPVLQGLVTHRRSLIVSGATGTGKTTLMATMLGDVPAGERIVLIEEAGEARPDHPHVVRLVERHANVDGAGAMGLSRLVREALRMRPDRLVVGECRGAEVREILLALNTGHAGGITTLHANTAEDVPARLIALGALADLGERAVALHAAAAFDAVVHVERTAAGRRVAQIAVLGVVDGVLTATVAVTATPDGGLVPGPAWRQLLAASGQDLSVGARASAAGRQVDSAEPARASWAA